MANNNSWPKISYLVYSAVAIQLHQTGEQINLGIGDNGVGMHLFIKENERNYLCIDLIKGLIKYVNGEIYFEVEKGTEIMFIFSVDPLNDNNSLLITSTEKMVNQ